MRRRFIPTLALFASACAAPAVEPDAAKEGVSAEDQRRRGEALYRSHGCIACHGTAGRGDGLLAGSLDPRPRNLRDPATYRQGHSVEEVSRTIGMGVLGPKVSPMPSYPHLSRSDKDALAAWVVSLQDAADGAPLAVRGWVRAAPPSARVTAAYLTLGNRGDVDRVIAAVSAEGFETVEIHESREVDGVHQMRPLDRLVVPAGASVELAPGGVHLMLIGPESPLEEGRQCALKLRFEDGAEQELAVPVRARAEAP